MEVRSGIVRASSLSVKKAVLHDLTNGLGATAPPVPAPAIKGITTIAKQRFLVSTHHFHSCMPSVELIQQTPAMRASPKTRKYGFS